MKLAPFICKRMSPLSHRFMRGDGWCHGGDSRHKESIALLKMSDIVVTNPPFSLFRKYIVQWVEYEKWFLILGNANAL